MNQFGKYLFLGVLSGTWFLTTAQTANVLAAQAMAQVQNAIANMVRSDSRLTPEFLRMGFHDCVGGCDGCIDLSNPENNGLARPISMLDPIVRQFATPSTGLSRPDIWAIAATVAADVADHGTANPISFTQTWFGRVSCEDANSVCQNANGQVVPCSATAGPHRVLPSATFDSNRTFSYFANNFGFNERQTVAIMGAHTVGHLLKNESGINGPHGWTINNAKLQNEYYNALITTATAATPDNQKADLAPRWRRFFEDNSGTSFPSIWRWQLTIDGIGNLTMLDSDISLVRNLNSGNTNPTTGQVSCTFNSPTGSPVCPIRSSSINIAAQFSDDNNLWLREFKAVLDLMLTNGYNRVACSSSACQLVSNRPPITPVAPSPLTPAPTSRPPTMAPTSLPTQPPSVVAQAMTQAQNAIANMVRSDSRLTPEFLRMGFHDCIGGCDGCIDLSNPENNGLARPISMLDPIVRQFATPSTGLSRPDIWAIAATVAADVADHGTANPISFTQTWFGRVSCEDANSVCRNANGQVVPCSATAGPHRVLPVATFDSSRTFSYFANNFGFNERQTVAIMGAHTVGHLLKNESGINGPHGWTINNVKLQNEYYNALITTATAATPDSQKADLAPRWRRFFEDNSGTSFPSIWRWQLTIDGIGNLTMLDSDISLVRDLNSGNTNPITGQVSCTFNSPTGSPVCPIRSSSINVAAQFSDDNNLWLREFKAVLDLMLTNGYNRVACGNSVCRLTTGRPAAPGQTPINAPVQAPASCASYLSYCRQSSECCGGRVCTNYYCY